MNPQSTSHQRSLTITLAACVALCGLHTNSGGAAKARPATGLSQTVYSDSKGFFKVRPPDGWLVTEYLSDPRGKVDFNSSSGTSKAQLKIIGQASPFSNFDELLADCKAGGERIRARVGGIVTVSATTAFGTKAVEIVVDARGKLKQRQIQVLFGENYYTFAFVAPLDSFDEYCALATKSMETFEPLFKDHTGADATAHTLASKIRTAELYLSVGRMDWALVVIDEGLRLDKGNKKLLELKARCGE